jgi:hypothetical protein
VKRIAYLLVIVSTIISCSEDEQPPQPKTYFELTVDEHYWTERTEDWVVIQDQDNKLLAAKMFESGQSFVFDTVVTVNEPITISFFQRSSGTQERYTVSTYHGLAVGEKWTLGSFIPLATEGTTLGPLSVTLNDPNSGHELNTQISSKYGERGVSTRDNLAIKFNPLTYSSSADDLFLFAADKNRNPKYKFIENAAPGNLSITLADFSDFDKQVTIALPQASTFSAAIVRAYETGQVRSSSHGYCVNFFLEGLNGSTIDSYRLGFLNRFTKYWTIAFATYSGYSISYDAYGDIPSSNITMQKMQVAISNNSLSAFAVSGDFKWRSSIFEHNPSSGTAVYQTFYSDNTNVKNPPLPNDFLKMFPTYSTANLKHRQTAFYNGVLFEDAVLRSLRSETRTQDPAPYVQTSTSIF